MRARNVRRGAGSGAGRVFSAWALAALALLSLLAAAASARPDPPASALLLGTQRRAVPLAPAIVSAPRDPSASRSARFEFSAPAENVRFRCRVDAQPAIRCRSPVEYRRLAHGSHGFRVRAVYRDGERTAAASYRWTVDTRRPARPILTDRPPPLTSGIDARFEFSDPQERVVFACQLDAGAADPCTSPQSYRGLAPGGHRFTVVATDAAGNASAPAAHRWTVDVVAPEPPVIDEAPGSLTNATSARFAFSSREPGARLDCALDDAAATQCASPLELTGLADGRHRLTVTATDGAGNVSAFATHEWSVDATAPARPTITGHPATLTTRTDAELRFSGPDDATLVCRLDGVLATPCASPQVYGPLADGPHTFGVAARDRAGNRSAPAELGWTVDTTLYRAQVARSGGLLAYWRLGETAWGPAADATGAHPGTYTRGVALGLAGALVGDADAAAGFDGLTGEMFATTPAVSTNASLEGWFDWRRGTALMRDNTGPSGGWILAFEASGGRLAYRAGATTFTTALTAASLRGGWHHLVLTKAGADVALYVDGRPVHTGTGATSNGAQAPWHVMNNGTNADQYAEGRADDVAVYDVALAPDVVLSHYLIGSGS